MRPDVPCADAPRSLQKLLSPLSSLLGVSVGLAQGACGPFEPSPGHQSHVLLHQAFPERGHCPTLDTPTLIPATGNATTGCPLGLTELRFPLPTGDGGTGVLTIGPYFLDPSDRESLRGRSQATDEALRELPYLKPARHEQIKIFYAALSAFVASALQADATKELFLANISHELRTPLNGIMGMLSLLLQGELGARQRQFLQLAMAASNQLLGTVNDLLEMAHISMGSLELVERVFGLRQTLSPLLGASAEEAAARGLHFTVDIAGDVPESLLGDPVRLLQVMRNLIENAVKFTESGSVTIRISRLAEDDAPDRSTLLFAVSDTGIGIPRNRQDRIFDRFTIGEDFLGKRYGNTGIGLSISKEIVEKMGGTITVESVSGQGSVFSFTAVFRHAGVSPSRTAIPQPPKPFLCQGAVIVCAGTDPVAHLLLRRILEGQGYVTLRAKTTTELQDILRTQSVDLIVLDMDMHEPNLPELLHALRAGGLPNVPPDLPILGLLDRAPPQEVQARFEAVTGTIAKPITRQEILEAVCRALPQGPPSPLL